MPLDYALTAMHRSRTVSAGATVPALRTGSCVARASLRLIEPDPLAELKMRLYNWGRYSRAWAEDQDANISPMYASYIPHKDYDGGHGQTETEKAVEQETGIRQIADDWQPPIFEQDAQTIDRALFALGLRLKEKTPGHVHYLIIKRHYYNRKDQSRDLLDAAVRALGDIL